MLGGFLALISAVSFAWSNATVRRGVLSGTVLQAVGISLPIALPVFVVAMLVSGGFTALASFNMRSWGLLAVAGVIHFAWGRYCNYRATKAIGANLVAPIQQCSLIITLALAIFWLGEPLTVLRLIGIALVIAGPAMTLKPAKRPVDPMPPESAGDSCSRPNRVKPGPVETMPTVATASMTSETTTTTLEPSLVSSRAAIQQPKIATTLRMMPNMPISVIDQPNIAAAKAPPSESSALTPSW